MKRVLAVLSLLLVATALLYYSIDLGRPVVGRLLSRDVPERMKAPVRPADRPLAKGRLYAERARFQLAIYYLPRPEGDPRTALQRLLSRRPSLRLGTAADGASTVSMAKLDIAEYRPPDEDLLTRFGKGLTPAQIKALQSVEAVFGLDFSYRPADGFDVVRDAQRLLLDLARETKGVIWDEETRECFAPDAWDEERVSGWSEGLPHLPSHFVIHQYRTGELTREITLGMAKFGLPDVVVNDISGGDARSMASLVNLTCQTLAEKGRLDRPGTLLVDVHSLKDERLRESLEKSTLKGASGTAELTLVNARREEGDPANRLFEIGFPRGEGVHLQEAQTALLARVFGAVDRTEVVRHDQELLELSQRQRAQLPRLANAFRAGLRPGETLLVKAPFATDDGGREWMWVEALRWSGGEIEGILQNQPDRIAALRAGARVKVQESQVFDYLLRHPDGTSEGNETGKLLERRRTAAGR